MDPANVKPPANGPQPDSETRTRWERHDDPFLGRCAHIQLAPYAELTEKSQHGAHRRDYAAHLTNISSKYSYERRFLKRIRGSGRVCVPCDRLGEGAVIEVRVATKQEYFRCAEGELKRIDDSEVRAAIALWRFSTGQPLHEVGS